MKNVTNNSMKHLYTVALAGICLLALTSCNEGNTETNTWKTWGAAPTEQIEIVSPTGCLKSKGRYYDPKLKTCVKVDNQHQANVLNAYRYVNQLAEKDAGVTEYAIYPKKYLTIAEAEVLWSDLREHGGKMDVLNCTMPDDRVYDSEQEWNINRQDHNSKLRVWAGPGSSYSWGWRKGDNASADTIKGMLIEGIKTREQERPRPELRKAVLIDGDCRIGLMSVHIDSKAMLDWINRHIDDVEGVQPIVDYLDKNMPEYGPRQALKEGE
jgi:hypothetical protein